MKNEDIFNVHSAFVVNTALIIGFMLTLSLASFSDWQKGSTLGHTPTPLNSSATLSHTH
jgi:hypothetical protein